MKENKLLMNQFVGKKCGNRLMKMKLQFFAEGGEGDGTDGGQDGDEGDGESKPISFTSQSEFDSVVDKRISKAIETAQAKWQEEADKKIKDAEKKGQMSAEEKAQYELQQERDQLKADRVALKRDKDEAGLIKRLATDKLPDSLSTVLAPLFGGDERIWMKLMAMYLKPFVKQLNKQSTFVLQDQLITQQVTVVVQM